MSTTTNNNKSSSEQEEEEKKELLAQKVWDIYTQKQSLEEQLRFAQAAKPVTDYSDFVRSNLERSLKFISDNTVTLKSKRDSRMAHFSEIHKDYDFDDNTVYDAIKTVMDTLDATCKPLQEAHDARKKAMRLEIQRLEEEEKAAREAAREAADKCAHAAKRAAKRAKTQPHQ